MRRINFITNQALESATGGWCGISNGIYRALAGKADVNFVGPVEPDVSIIEKLTSKVLRSTGLQGNFFYFSERRLSRIRDHIHAEAPVADFDFYFGATSWLSCSLERPYGVFIDALFPTYMRIFGEPDKFREADLARIQQREENWLSKASHIFWTSDWARKDGSRYEHLDLVEAAGPWDESLSLHDDGEFFTRVLLNAQNHVFVPDARVYYRSVEGSLSRQRDLVAIESAFKVCRLRDKHLLAVRDDERVRTAIATQYAQFAYEFSFADETLCKQALERVGSLAAKPSNSFGGPWFRRLVGLIGFRLAFDIRQRILKVG